MNYGHLRKVVILGTTGSGKTTFLRNLVGDLDGNDAETPRHVTVEEAQVINTFSALDRQLYENSTTTISLNVRSILFYTTRTNSFEYHALENNKLLLPPEDYDCLYPIVMVDTAGQERFEFMQDIGVIGADAVIIFADGTNVQSIERISHFYNKIKEEMRVKNKTIPIVVFVNKRDLQSKGLYVGKEAVIRWVPELKVDIYETSNIEMETFNIPIRNFLNKIIGFPLSLDKIQLKAES